MAKDHADCGLADCGFGLASLRFRDVGPLEARFRRIGAPCFASSWPSAPISPLFRWRSRGFRL
eukprot:13800973-Alexandrium_andersonii.AAC.1